MKQPTFHGRVLLPLSVFADARAGDPLAMERILRYYDGYMNKLCTRTLYELDGSPHVRLWWARPRWIQPGRPAWL